MLIDFHTHIFPDALAPKAIASLQLTAGMPVMFDGTAAGLTGLMEADGVGKSVVLNTVTNAKQVSKVNAFALETDKRFAQLIPFCSLHPLTENPLEKLLDFKSKGIKGVKLHPDYMGMTIDDEGMKPLLKAISLSGLPVVIHAGYDPVSPNKMHASPDAICKILEEFPDLILVAAHLGGVNVWDEVAEKLCGKNLYLDTAFCCERIGITVEQGKRIFERHPADKILFGSDAPWASPKEILEFLNKLELPQSDMELILWKNAEKLLNL